MGVDREQMYNRLPPCSVPRCRRKGNNTIFSEDDSLNFCKFHFDAIVTYRRWKAKQKVATTTEVRKNE